LHKVFLAAAVTALLLAAAVLIMPSRSVPGQDASTS
jgi:hypothetical protein